MARPGTQIIQRETPPARSAPTDTSVWFVAGLADRGPLTPQLVRNMADFERIYGARVSYSVLYDALDVFFKEGGGRAYVARVVGPSYVVATHNLMDGAGTPAVSLRVDAVGPGSSYNALSVGVRAGSTGGTYEIFVQDGGVEVDSSGDLTTQQDAVNWSQASQYVRVTLGVSSLVPATAAAAALASGADDRSSVADADWVAALTQFSVDLGPGQVSQIGRTTTQAHLDTLAHAATHNRVALLDAANSSSVSALQAAAAASRTNGRFGGLFAPWDRVPGLVDQTIRTVPPSARIAGNLARNDTRGVSPSSPAAGDLGLSAYLIDLSQPAWTDAQRELINEAGVNVTRNLYGGFRTYGWRSLANPVLDPAWKNLGHARLYMTIAARANAIAETHLFKEIDGAGIEISAFNGDLTAMLLELYNLGSLYGATASEAFYVDTGPSVNTPETLENNELRAVLSVRMSPFAELVTIEIVKRSITEAVV